MKLRREIGRREILTPLFHEINQEFESQRFQLHQASRWADQAQRDKMSLYGELEFRNRLFQEHHARDCQAIVELRGFCCEETEQAMVAACWHWSDIICSEAEFSARRREITIAQADPVRPHDTAGSQSWTDPSAEVFRPRKVGLWPCREGSSGPAKR